MVYAMRSNLETTKRRHEDKDMRFTAEDALEVEGTKDAIMIDIVTCSKICEEHGADLYDYFEDQYPLDSNGASTLNHNPPALIDAGKLLGWLGY